MSFGSKPFIPKKKAVPPPPDPVTLLHGDIIKLKELASSLFEYQKQHDDESEERHHEGMEQMMESFHEGLAELATKINPNIDVKAPIVNVPAPVVNVPAPVVNVPTPVVNVPAPIVNVPPPDVIFDNEAVLKKLDTLIEQSKAVPSNKPVILSSEDRSMLQSMIEQLEIISKKDLSVQVRGGGGGLMQGQFNDNLQTLSTGNTAAPRLTSKHALHVNLRDNSGNEIGTIGSPVNVSTRGDYSVFGPQVVESERQYATGVFDTTASMNAVTFDSSANGGSSAATSANLVIQSGTSTTGDGHRRTKTQLVYVPGQEGRVKFTAIFDSAVSGAKQQIGFFSEDGNNGAYFEKDGTGLSVVHKRGGSIVSQVYSSTWNGDITTEFTDADGTVTAFTDTEGQVYRIRFGYLGYWGIQYQVMAPNRERWVTIHTFRYTGQTVPIFADTTLDFVWRVIKTSGASNVTLKCGSFNISTVGERRSTLVSSVNYTETALSSGATFTGDWFCHEGYGSLEIAIKTDQISASNGIVIEFSERGDSSAVFKTKRFETFNAGDVTNGFKRIVIPPELSFTRVSYTNGGTGQGSFFLQTRFHEKALELSRGNIEADVVGTNTALMVRDVILAKNAAGTYGNVERGTSGGLDIGIVQHEVPVPIKALTSFKTTQVSVLVTATQVAATALTNRKSVSLKSLSSNGSSKSIFIGTTSAVSTSTGFELAAGDSIDMEVDDTVALWAISNSGTQTLCVCEIAGASTS